VKNYALTSLTDAEVGENPLTNYANPVHQVKNECYENQGRILTLPPD
jgi:hypothetical protein